MADQTKEETVITPKTEEKESKKEETEKDKKDEKATKTCDFCQSEIPAKATRCRYCGSILSKKSTEENDQFSIQREEIKTQLPSGLTEIFNKVTIIIKDEQLKANLKSYMNNNPRFFDKEPHIPADELFTILPNLRQAELGWAQSLQKSPFHFLLKFLEKEYEELAVKFDQMLKERVITFEALQFIFQRGVKFWGLVDGEFRVGSEVIETSYQRNMFATFFVVTGEVIKSSGERFFSNNHQFVINNFKGVKKIDDLPVQPMTDETMAYLNARGKKFNEIGCGCHYLQYVGKMIYKTTYYTTSWKSDGRIMIDGTSFNKMNPNYREFTGGNNLGGNRGVFFNNHGNQQNADQSIKAIPEESWYKTWPTVGGFSFSSKKWGEIIVEGCTPVNFDDSAFHRLVLNEEKKALIKALVLHTENAFADIITGKGAGCIFLLHGPPGCGKTLTAEAIAEMLHRPLYSVSVGELGTNTETLETKLRDILEVASVWNSVILIDEADIFLEKRTDNDIKRNAMVGIFLRLLEYHQGILFLTTNRVKRFDDAFHSRISIALKYDELGSDARNKVWKNFFDAAKINGLDENVLCKYELNGRQIRTTIRLAQALAKNEKTLVKMNHVERTISVAAQFQKDLKSYDSPIIVNTLKGVGLTTLVGLGTVGGLFLFKFLNKHI